MTRRFRVGDHVGWNSEAGRVSGRIIAVHTADFDYKGHVHRASKVRQRLDIIRRKNFQSGSVLAICVDGRRL